MKLVIFPAVEPDRFEPIVKAAGDMQVVNATDVEYAKHELADADAFFGKMTPDLLSAAGQLRWVQSPTASLEHYLFAELIDHPCVVSNMRGLFFDVIADHVMTYTLCFARNMHHYIRQQLKCEWNPIGGVEHQRNFVTGPGRVSPIDRSHLHLSDCTMGIVGVGSIGSEVGRRALGFGMRVTGVDPHCRSIPGVTDDIWNVEHLPKLLQESDFVTIAAPHTPETEKMFRREQFRLMKSSAFLINIGRGIIVDLADLTIALENQEIAGAALDVFETEPLPADHPLWGRDNVIITPHIAAASPRVAERHTETLLENIRRFVAGKPLLTPVDKRRWY